MNVANLITFLRLLGSFLLLGMEPFSFGFTFLYLLCGFSDMLDGPVARRRQTASAFGAKLDTVADFCFVLVMLYKLLPLLDVPLWLLYWVLGIAFIKMGTVFYCLWRDHCLVSNHSCWNKATGLLLFLLPFSFPLVGVKYSGSFVSVVATAAALHEAFVVYRRQN